ncbi:MAG: HNH endonuclease [Victivallales bacterium]|nr:HNH endonuclease [Victivallales bacterium]
MQDSPDIPSEANDSFEGFLPADDEHIAREKRKAREMRQSQWWKNELGKGVCHWCGRHFRPSELTMDHIVPIIRGGFTRKGNVVPCCKECNSKKQYLLPSEWREYMERQKQASSSKDSKA